MAYSSRTPIRGLARGNAQAMYAWARDRGCKRSSDVRRYLQTIYELAPKLDLNPDVLVAQSILETSEDGAPWASQWWQQRLNPAGIGITGNKLQNEASRDFGNGEAAARAHLLHLHLYAYGDKVPDDFDPSEDPRWKAAINAKYAGIATTLDDLTNTWAKDLRYAEKIADRLNALDAAGLLARDGTGNEDEHGKRLEDLDDPVKIVERPDETEIGPEPASDVTPGSLTFHRVPHPDFVDMTYIARNKIEGVGWDNLGQRKPKFVALHRMWGTLKGTDSYFAPPKSPHLTDYAIGVLETDGKALAGEIHKYNDPLGYRAGWASGRVSKPYGDGKAIVDKYGINAVNRDGVSIELSGYDTTPVDDFSWSEYVKLIAYWIDYMEIPYHSLPINPHTGISAFVWHEEFTFGTGKKCPFTYVKNNTKRLIADVKAYLQPYQTGRLGKPETPPAPDQPDVVKPVYAPPMPIPALVDLAEDDDLSAVVTDEAKRFYLVNDRVEAIRDTKRRQSAPDGPSIGPDLKRGEQFDVTWLIREADGEEWYVTDYWTRIKVSDTRLVSDTRGETN